MTDSNKPTYAKAPTHIAYHVRENGKDESFWTRIGAAWPHADGKGFTLQLDVVPLDGRVNLRLPSEKSN